MAETYTNLPQAQKNDSATKSLQYFNEYGQEGLEFKAEDVDATIGFLKGKGFGEQASIVTGIVLLKQAKLDNVPVYKLLDSLEGLETLQLSSIVGDILNQNRFPTSALGFRTAKLLNEEQQRIILA
jgi:hypothetical protein